VDQPALSISEQRQLRRDRAELDELRALGLDGLEHAPARTMSFASMSARLEAKALGSRVQEACWGRH